MITSKHPVLFKNRQGIEVPYDADLDVIPLSWSGSDTGGPKVATIRIEGPRVSLKAIITNWLRYDVLIQTPRGTPAWWGYVHEVQLDMDGLSITASLDNLRNRISVTYTSLEGTVEQGLSLAWLEDAGSVAAYGIKEHFESLGSATTAMANTFQTTMLNQMSKPKLKRSIGSPGKPAVTLKCYGWIETTSWLYYQRITGRIEHFLGSSKIQPIGWSILGANNIGFGGYGIHDPLERFSNIAAGMDITVGGSSLNNIVYPITDTATEEAWTLTASSISFEATDDMFEGSGLMTGLKSDSWVQVLGSAANSRWHWIGSAGSEHTRFSAAVSGEVVTEAAGPSITLLQAQKLPSNARGNYEAPGTGALVNLVLHGHKISQRFFCTTSMTISSVFLEAAKWGAPVDALSVAIYSDSGGNLGSSLSSGSLAATSLSEDSNGVWIPITQLSLSGGSYYWIVVDRTGAVSGTDHYLVSMTEEVSLTCRMWNGSAWVAHKPGWFLKYRLWATEDTGTMIETMLSTRPQFMTYSLGYTSGVSGYSTMDQIMTVKDEMMRLLSIGTSAGLRIQMEVSPDKNLRLKTQPINPQPQDTLRLSTSNGIKLTDSVGSDWPQGLLPYGMYVALIDLDADLQVEQGLSPALIEEVEYDAETETWNISFGGERSLADILKVQQG